MSNPAQRPLSLVNGERQSHHVGMIGEGRFIAWASAQGWHLYRGLDGHTPCDFVVDMGDQLARVEVKRIEALQHTHKNYYYVTVTKLDPKRFDFMFVSTPGGDYWIPACACPTKTLSIKVQQSASRYGRNITRAGKYEEYRCG